MKKIALYGLASVLALSFAACDNYEEPNPTPQTNAQESILKTSDIAVENALEETAYDLKALNDAENSILVAKVLTTELPEGYDFGVDIFISSNGFQLSTPVKGGTVTRAEDGTTYNVTVNPDDLQAAYFSGISKGPKAKEIEIRFLLKTVTGKQVAYVGGLQNFYGDYKLTVIPFPSELVIEEAYYILGTFNGWSVANAIKFNHSDANQYDDPVFTVKVEITADQAADGWWWKIIPQSTYANGDWVDADYSQFGVAENGSEEASGLLIPKKDGQDPGAGCFKQEGQWRIMINLEEGTYEFSPAVDFLYTPGDANDWSQTNSQLLYTNDYTTYMGYAMLSPNGFKFSNAPDWDHVNYGDGGAPGILDTDGDAGNLSVPAYGLYWCNVNTASLTYSVAPVQTIGVIGDATPGGWDTSTALTTADQLIWKGTVKFTGGGFKFRANDAWDINLGGNLQNLLPGGDNIPSPGEGTYEVTLDLSRLLIVQLS